MAEWLDITRPVHAGMAVYSKAEGFCAEQLFRCAKDGYNLSRFGMGAHCGTHVDAPAHFIQNGQTIESAPIDLFIGRARVLTAQTDAELRSVSPGETRLLLRGEFPGLTEEQADFLVKMGARLVGVQSLSVAEPKSEKAVHTRLLKNGVWILENLALEDVSDGLYDFICLPLKLQGLEGAPARVVIRRA